VTLLESLTPSDDYFDVAQGLYWHCADYHEGQWSERYSILSAQLGYKPSPMEYGPTSEVSQDVYDALAAGTLEPSDTLAFVNLGYEESR
jgi:hypothetical protein